MFEHRHYELLADWLANASMAINDLDRHLVAHSLADRLERDNPRFNRNRFLAKAITNEIAWDLPGAKII